MPNSLNQYSSKENNTVKVLGTAAATAKVAVKGAAATGKTDRAWGTDLVPANTGGAAQGTATVYAAFPGGGAGGLDLIRTDGQGYFAAPALQHFSYDADGNLTGDSVWSYTYDAENRLVRMTSLLPAGFGFTRQRLDFRYDAQGRRVEKTVFNLDTSTQTLARRYLYDGWNLIAETDTAGNLQRTFTWGLDLAGSLTATGGVGALLQIADLAAGKTLAAAYDGNGNITGLINADTGALEAAYEYNSFGELMRIEGAYAKSNPFRFSSKWQDDETGLVNYGFRYYSPTLGRFVNRDTIEEKGGLNLYGFVGNDGVNRWDVLGQDQYDDAGAFENHGRVNRQGIFLFSPGGSSGGDFGPGTDLTQGHSGSAITRKKTDGGGLNFRQAMGDLAKLAEIQGRLDSGQSVTVIDATGRTVVLTPSSRQNFAYGGVTVTLTPSDNNGRPNGWSLNANNNGAGVTGAPNSGGPEYTGPAGGVTAFGRMRGPVDLQPSPGLTAGEFFKALWDGASSSLSVNAGSGWRIGPVGSSATLSHQLSDGLLGGTGQVNVTTSPRSGFGFGGNYYAGLSGGFRSDTPTAGTFTIGAGAGLFARISIGWGQGGLTTVQFTGGLGFGLSTNLQLGANAPVLKVNVSPSGNQTNQVGPIPPWD